MAMVRPEPSEPCDMCRARWHCSCSARRCKSQRALPASFRCVVTATARALHYMRVPALCVSVALIWCLAVSFLLLVFVAPTGLLLFSFCKAREVGDCRAPNFFPCTGTRSCKKPNLFSIPAAQLIPPGSSRHLHYSKKSNCIRAIQGFIPCVEFLYMLCTLSEHCSGST